MSESADEVRSLARGLEILKELNKAGSARPGTLARRVGLARSTVYRLLETLEECGFIAKSASDERYRITGRTGRLFARYDSAETISTSARGAFSDAARRSPWLMHLSTFELENGAMVIRLASRSATPLLPSRGYIGNLLPLLRSAAGRAYLAACSDQQRREILQHGRIDGLPCSVAQIDAIVAETSSLGYAAGDDNCADPAAASISTALTRDGYALGALTAVHIRSVTDNVRARTELLEFLRGEARSIERHLHRSAREDAGKHLPQTQGQGFAIQKQDAERKKS
jgi:IclR family mhp operon transcriptional activator